MPSKSPKPLDRIDLKILRALVRDAKISMADLAEIAGLSTSPCWQRVRRLEEEGYVTGYTVRVDQEKLGSSEIVFVDVSLVSHDEKSLQNFSKLVEGIDEILEVYLTSGEHDYLLKVAVSGARGYEDFLLNRLSTIPGIRQTRSSFALRCLKKTQVFIPQD
jgi:Lrp/AsnC family leucine-responsive transcriptional regulator